MKQKNIYFYTNILTWGLVLFLIGNYAFGWTTPSAIPPSANLPAPINASSDTQTKTGGLNIATGGGNVGIGTTAPGAKLDVSGGLNLTDRTYTLHDSVRTFENVAHYYVGSTPTTGTIVITIGSTPNIMLEAEIVVQGYTGLTKCQVRGYTYTGSTTWHLPAATCLSSGHSGGYTVRFGKRISDNARVILLGTTSSVWGNYPHVAVTRVTFGYPGSGSSIGDWSISMVTDESVYSNIVGVSENSGFAANNPTFTGTVTAPTFSGALSGNATSATNADKLDDYHGASASTVNTYALRNASGDINTRLFRSEYDITNATIGYIMTQIDTASNNYIRPSTPAQLVTELGLVAGGSRDIWVEKAGDTMSGALYTTQLQTPSTSSYDKIRVYNSSSYTIGFHSGMTYGGLNDYAMTFTMNPEADRGWLWRDTSDAVSDGAMSLTTTGVLKVKGNITAAGFYYASDESLKKNVQEIETPLAKIMKLDGISFDWKESGEKSIGLIAQDVEKVFPEIVNTDEDTGLKYIQYAQLVAPLIEATKEQQKMIDEQKELIDKQGEEIKALKVSLEQS